MLKGFLVKTFGLNFKYVDILQVYKHANMDAQVWPLLIYYKIYHHLVVLLTVCVCVCVCVCGCMRVCV